MKTIFFVLNILALVVITILWFAIRAFGDANSATIVCGMWLVLLVIFMRKMWIEIKENG